MRGKASRPLSAPHVLGHELGHLIIEPWYSHNDDYSKEIIAEAECDRIGAILYRLAEMIAEESAESKVRYLFKKADE